MDRYAVHDHAALPASGRFNAGQKMLFWSQVFTTLALFATGIVLWFPEVMPRGLRLAAILLHPLAAIGSIAGILVHIYMGTASVPYSMQAMLKGYVSPAWARSHHAKWHKTWKETGHS
jgi:formate dehydrogenase subunit gamma